MNLFRPSPPVRRATSRRVTASALQRGALETGRVHLPFLLALVAALSAVVVPVGVVVWRSFHVTEVEMKSGEVYVASGDVVRTDRGYDFSIQEGPGAPKVRVPAPHSAVVDVRNVFSLRHYKFVLGDSRTHGLLKNSALVGLGAALLALLFGIPIAWLLARTRFRGRALLAVLCLAPAILPPFFIALGGARVIQRAFIDWFGWSGSTLQFATAIVVFGSVLYPLVVLLLTPSIAGIPAGPWESARLLGGRRAAFRTVTLPAILPAILGAFVLAFVVALGDFVVPDLMGVMLPGGGTPGHVLSTEVLLQWKQEGNVGRAVATSAPFLLLTTSLVVLGLWFLRRSPLFGRGRGARPRDPVKLALPWKLVSVLFVAGVLWLSLWMPFSGIASWTSGFGETVAQGSSEVKKVSVSGELFDFKTALDNTPGGREERDRWLRHALAAALLALLIALPLAHGMRERGGVWRFLVLLAAVLPLAVPGLVLSAGTKLLWMAVPFGDGGSGALSAVLVRVAKFFPFALLASWLALRSVRRGQEQAASLLGARTPMAAWGPATWLGIASAGLVVLVLSLRELEAVILLDARILPLRLYDKIHFSRLTDEANLLLLCLLYLMIPALLLAAVLAFRARRRRS